jgi:hypothetical protein
MANVWLFFLTHRRSRPISTLHGAGTMTDKRTMTLNLSANEMAVVEKLADDKGLSKTALVRQALRLYQSISDRIERGEKVFVENPTTKDKAELMVLS